MRFLSGRRNEFGKWRIRNGVEKKGPLSFHVAFTFHANHNIAAFRRLGRLTFPSETVPKLLSSVGWSEAIKYGPL